MVENIDTLGFKKKEFDSLRVCDGCATKFHDNSYALVYFTDLVWAGYQKIQFPIPTPQELYCFDCYPNEIPIPHIESTEGFTIVEFTSDSSKNNLVYEEIGILNINYKNDGVDWDPVKIMDDHQFLPVEEVRFQITPMQVFSYFRKLGIDLRGFVKNNKLTIPDEKINDIESLIQLRLERSDPPIVPHDEH